MLSGNAESGRYSSDRTPYLREILDAAVDPLVTETVFMKSAQVGWTEGLNNLVGFYIHLQPSSILYVQPTLDMAKALSKERLSPMIADTPALRGLVRDPRSRDSGNTTLHKIFAGGSLTITGANSAAGLRSRAVRVLLLDEIDGYPKDCQGEGDPIKLAEKRTQTFADRRIFKGSTPTVAGESSVERAFEQSDQRKYQVPCPACDHLQVLQFDRLAYEAPGIDPETRQYRPGKYDETAYCCESCGYLIPHSEKTAMLAAGRWVAEKPFTGVAGFWINALYSPWVTWGQIAEEFERVKGNITERKTFVNTVLGIPWKDSMFEVNVDDAGSHRELYEFPVPDGVLLLVAGIDVQGDRFEIEVLGFGLDDETWSVHFEVIPCDPSTPAAWQSLKDWLLTDFAGRDGKTFRIAAACIDAGGHHSQEVYRFTEQNAGRRWWATRGSNRPGMPLIPFHQSTTKKGRFFWIGTETAKDWFFGKLGINEKGPGYCHFPAGYDEEYFRQLHAEKPVTTYHNGYPVRRYVKVRERNEALDCRVLAIAARFLLRPNLAEIAKRATPVAQPKEPAETPAPTNVKPQPVQKSRFKIKGGFVNSWRR